MNLTNLSKQDLLAWQYLIGRIVTWYLLNLRTLIIKNLEIGAEQTTILTRQVLTI